MTIRFFISGAALLGLTACGGASAINLGAGPASFGDLVTEQIRLNNLVTGGGYVPTDPDVGVGMATFDGVAQVFEPGATVNDTAYLGQVHVDVDFDTNDLDGTANNFYQHIIGAGLIPVGPIQTRDGTITFATNFGGDTNFAVPVAGTFDPDGGGLHAVTGNGTGNFTGPGGATTDAFGLDAQITVDGVLYDLNIVAD